MHWMDHQQPLEWIKQQLLTTLTALQLPTVRTTDQQNVIYETIWTFHIRIIVTKWIISIIMVWGTDTHTVTTFYVEVTVKSPHIKAEQSLSLPSSCFHLHKTNVFKDKSNFIMKPVIFSSLTSSSVGCHHHTPHGGKTILRPARLQQHLNRGSCLQTSEY